MSTHREPVQVEVPEDIKPGDTLVVDPKKKAPDGTMQAEHIDSQPKYATEADFSKVQKQLNSLSAAQRNFEKYSRELQDMKSKLEAIPQMLAQRPMISPSSNQNEWDTLVEQDWQKAVSGLAKVQIDEYMAQANQQYQRQMEEYNKQQYQVGQLEQSKQLILQRHPDLASEHSDKAKLYMQIFNDDQSLYYNPRGPEIAMYRMENELKKAGLLDEETEGLVDKESARRLRAGASRVPTGTRPGLSKRTVLDVSQKKFCDRNNIRYEDYEKMVNLIQTKGEGVEA